MIINNICTFTLVLVIFIAVYKILFKKDYPPQIINEIITVLDRHKKITNEKQIESVINCLKTDNYRNKFFLIRELKSYGIFSHNLLRSIEKVEKNFPLK